MKVKIFKWANIEKHCESDLKMLKAFRDFKDKLEYADWVIPSDILKTFNQTDIIACKEKNYNRIIFNVGGNKYRLICGYKFGKNKIVLYIRFVGTHKEYDKIKNVCEIDMF